jgi:hypothetical protein
MSSLVEPLLNHITTQNLALGTCRHLYVLNTYPRHDKDVLEHLESSSVEAFLPAVVSKDRWKDWCARVVSFTQYQRHFELIEHSD